MNEWVRPGAVEAAVLSLRRGMDDDCVRCVLDRLPTIVWERCWGCGVALVGKCGGGEIVVSEEARYAWDACKNCYFACQS